MGVTNISTFILKQLALSRFVVETVPVQMEVALLWFQKILSRHTHQVNVLPKRLKRDYFVPKMSCHKRIEPDVRCCVHKGRRQYIR